MYDQLVNFIYNSKLTKLKGPFLMDFFLNDYNGKSPKTKINIIILNAPCNGFGDLIFAVKLYYYLKEWYPSVSIKLASTYSSGLKQLGFNPTAIVELNAGKNNQCRRFAQLKMKKLPKQDLILVAPVMGDFSVDIKDVKKLLPYANFWNTYFFSEYNDSTKKTLFYQYWYRKK